MALIKCDECGKEVSSKAISCPSCGNPIQISNYSIKKKVVITRKSSFYGAAIKGNVLVNGLLIDTISSGGKIEIELPIGTHHINVETYTAFSNYTSPQSQFVIEETTNKVLIAISVKSNWSGGSGRCHIDKITYE